MPYRKAEQHEAKKFRLTTLCYIERDGCWLMLHRTKKREDQSRGKWLGIGGKFEDAESPEECMLREVREETGLTVTDYDYRGIVTFVSDLWETEYMHLFTVTSFTGQLRECDEGELAWIPKEEVLSLNLWEGDRLFLERLAKPCAFFSLKVVYEGDRLVDYTFY